MKVGRVDVRNVIGILQKQQLVGGAVFCVAGD